MLQTKVLFAKEKKLNRLHKSLYTALLASFSHVFAKLCNISRKIANAASKLFGPVEPFLVICILKTEKCRVGLKLHMNGTSVHIKNM